MKKYLILLMVLLPFLGLSQANNETPIETILGINPEWREINGNQQRNFVLDLVPYFGGQSVAGQLLLETGSRAGVKVILHNQDANPDKDLEFPYFFELDVFWANLSLKDTPTSRNTYDFFGTRASVGIWYEYFVVYGTFTHHNNTNLRKDRNFNSAGIGGGLMFPISKRFSAKLFGDLNWVLSGTPLSDTRIKLGNKVNWYTSATIGVGYRIF
jgi:hypothetical protein